MPEYTDYNNFELPEPFNVNERNEWGRILNDALDKIDDGIVRFGPLTDRPEPSVEGRLYLDTGSGTLYRDTGDSWQQFGSQTDIEESSSTVSVNPNTINFDRGFTVTEPSFRTAEVNISDIFVENGGDTMEGTLDMGSNDLIDGAQPIWDASIGEIPDSALGTIDNATLKNSSLTVTAGDGLKNGGSVTLGSSTTVDIEPSDFAGLFLQDDGSDNLDVLIGRGLEDDGTGDIRVDENTAFNFSNVIDFGSGLQTDGDIVNGSQVIWDESATEIPDGAMGTINNGTLANSSITLTAGDGLKNGGTVSLGSSTTVDIEPNDFAGAHLSDDGADNLEVDDDFLFNTGDSITGNLNFANSNSIQDNGVDAIQFDGTQGLILPNGGIRFEGGSARWTPGNRPVLEYTPGVGGDNENALFEFRTSDTNSREAYFGWDDSDNGIVFVNTTTNSELFVSDNIKLASGNLVDESGSIVYDQSNNYIPQSRLQNDSVTVTAGDGLKSGGSVSLGSSTTIDIEPADFAGEGVEDDGSDNLRTNEAYAHTWTVDQTFNAGWTLGGDADASSQRIRNLPEPTSDDEAARKGYVDGVAQGLNLKDSVATSDHDQQIDLTSTTDPNPLDGYTLSDGERVLLKHQNDATKNGIYEAVVATDPSTWVRSSDMDEDSEVTSGAFTFIRNGDTHANTSYIITTPDPITLGTTEIQWGQFAAAGAINAGDGLSKDGQTINTVVSEFAGTFLSADGNNNLTVDIGTGLENNSSNVIRVDEDYDYTFSSTLDFSAGLDTQGDISDGTQVIWDASAQEIPDSAMGAIANSTLSNDSITVNANDGLNGGGTVSLGGSVGVSVQANDIAGAFLTDDGSDNLDVNISSGLENDGSGNIRVDEDYDFTFTPKIDFTGGIDLNGNDIDNVSNIEMDGDIEGVGVDISIREVSDIVGPANGATSLELRTQGGGSHDVTIRDGANNQDIAIFDEGGAVSIPNGNIFLGDGNNINLNGSGARFTGSNISIDTFGNEVGIDATNGANVLRLDSQSVTIPSGDLTSGDTNSALEIDEEASLADTGKAQLSRDARPQGYAMIQDVTNDQSAMVYLGGQANTVEILHDSGSGNEFTTVEDNNGTTNIYYDGTNNRYEINNETGASATYSFQIMKA